jgi:hypothetical protein
MVQEDAENLLISLLIFRLLPGVPKSRASEREPLGVLLLIDILCN